MKPDATRLFIGAALIALLVVALNWLQGRFDNSDLEKATKVVSHYRPAGGTALSSAIARRHPGVPESHISWSSEILSGCLGHVRVTALVPAEDGHPPAEYSFDVDLNGPSVHPTDTRTVEILRSLTSSTSTTAR